MIVLTRATFFPHANAVHQLRALADTLGSFGPVVIFNPEPASEDTVFCRDTYVKIGERYILARFKKEAREAEVDCVAGQLPSQDLIKPPHWMTFEGGDIRKVNEANVICGYGMRTSLNFVSWLRKTSSVDVTAVRLIDSRTFHLDLCLCIFGETSALIVKDAFSRHSLSRLMRIFPDYYLVDMDDRFVCNGLKLHSSYIVSHAPYPVRNWLRQRGVNTVLVNCSAFHTQDGGVHCLTNEL